MQAYAIATKKSGTKVLKKIEQEFLVLISFLYRASSINILNDKPMIINVTK